MRSPRLRGYNPDIAPSATRFVQRGAFYQMRRAFEEGARGVLLTGYGGVGKTTLAHAFAQEATDLFPGGIEFLSVPLHSEANEIVSRLRSIDFDPLSSLIVIDDVDVLPIIDQARLLRSIFTEQPDINFIVISRTQIPVPSDVQTIQLHGFSRAELRDFVASALAEYKWDALNPEILEKLFRMSSGSPLLINLAFNAVRQHAVGSFDEFVQYARTFKTQGILGPDGKPATASEKRHLIIGVRNTNDEILRRIKQDPHLVHGLSPRKFEEIIAELVQDMGYDVTLTPESKDGGFDIYAARKDGLGKFLFLVECKRFVPPIKVGVNIVRSLYGILQKENANAGAVVTTSYFTSGANEFRQRIEHQLHLHDYITLQKWIAEFPRKKNGDLASP